MYSARLRLAKWVMRHRRASMIAFVMVTTIFATGVRNVEIRTIVSGLLPIGMVSYDRRGQPYRSFDGAYALYKRAGKSFMDGAHPSWSWTHAHVFDMQSGRMTRFERVRSITSGHATTANDPGIYDKYLTSAAMMRLGAG